MNAHETHEKEGREHFITGVFPLSWPMYDGVPAQPTHRRRLGGVKPFPGASKYDCNGQARRPGVWCPDDESTLDCAGDTYQTLPASPEEAISEVVDNGRELGYFACEWNAVERKETDAQDFTPDRYDVVFEAQLQSVIKRSYACSRVPEWNMVRLKVLRAEAMVAKPTTKTMTTRYEPKKEIVAPPVLTESTSKAAEMIKPVTTTPAAPRKGFTHVKEADLIAAAVQANANRFHKPEPAPASQTIVMEAPKAEVVIAQPPQKQRAMSLADWQTQMRQQQRASAA